MKKVFRPILLLTAALACAGAQEQRTATLHGQIAFESGKPAANVTVALGRAYTFTESSGAFELKNIPYGEQKVQVISRGTTLKEVPVTVNKAVVVVNLKVPEPGR